MAYLAGIVLPQIIKYMDTATSGLVIALSQFLQTEGITLPSSHDATAASQPELATGKRVKLQCFHADPVAGKLSATTMTKKDFYQALLDENHESLAHHLGALDSGINYNYNAGHHLERLLESISSWTEAKQKVAFKFIVSLLRRTDGKALCNANVLKETIAANHANPNFDKLLRYIMIAAAQLGGDIHQLIREDRLWRL